MFDALDASGSKLIMIIAFLTIQSDRLEEVMHELRYKIRLFFHINLPPNQPNREKQSSSY
jgi:hypothetical protein